MRIKSLELACKEVPVGERSESVGNGMKIVFYIPTVACGGAEKQCVLTAVGLREKYKHDVCVVVDSDRNADKRLVKSLECAGVALIVLPQGLVRSTRILYRILRENRESVLFAYLTRPNVMGGVIGRMAGVRAVYLGIRTTVLPFWKLVFEVVVNRMFATATIFNSHSAAKKWSWLFAKGKTMVIPNAREAMGRAISHEKNQIVVIVTVGRFVRDKDYPTMLRAFKLLKDNGVNFNARLMGYGVQETQVREMIVRYGLGECVQIISGDSDVNQFLRTADIYVSTSLFEGISNSILEAMDAGLPIVATKVGDNARLVEDGASGFLVDVGDVRAVADKIVALARDEELRVLYGKRAREILKANYSVERMLSSYNEIISSQERHG